MLWRSAKDVVSFPITFECLTMPPLWIFSQNWLVMWFFFFQAEAIPGSGKTPSPTQALFSGDGRGISPTFPDSCQQGKEQDLPRGFAGASGGEQRGESWQLLSGMTGLSLLSLPLPPVGSGCRAFHSPSAAPGRREEVGEKRERTSWFCVAQSL